MLITCLNVGSLSTNCYLVSDPETEQTIIIDPGDEADFISTTIIENKLVPQAIVLTHGHYDHCLAVLELKLNFNIPIYLHKEDLFLYEKAPKSASFWSNKSSSRLSSRPKWRDLTPPQLPPIDHYLVDSEIIEFGNSSLQVIHTPGHTPGSICLLSVIPTEAEGSHSTKTALFTGDTLFADSVGRTDLSYSSSQDLQKSLQKLRSEIHHPASTFLYPGHGEFGFSANFPTQAQID